MPGKVYIGTSGWHYKHWSGTFYPAKTRSADQFNLYLQSFKTVEINNSFYRLPSIKTFQNWAEAVPSGFVFSVKASRHITHMKKLKADKRSINKFLFRVDKLGDKLGPVLFQLPPGWKINIERLSEFLRRLPAEHRYTFEFRNDTWHHDEVYELLKAYNCAFCIYELDGYLSPQEVTADYIYIRLHGPGGKYQGSYSNAILKKWSDRIQKWRNAGKDVYLYFDNDQSGYAAFNAITLNDMIHKSLPRT